MEQVADELGVDGKLWKLPPRIRPQETPSRPTLEHYRALFVRLDLIVADVLKEWLPHR